MAARFRVEQAIDAAHPVSVLLVDGQVAAPCSLGLIGWLAVLVEQQCQPIGGRPPLRRSQTLGDPGKVCLGLVTGLTVDAAGQIVEELFDDAHMLPTDLASRLCGGGVRQLGRQRFSCYRSPRTEQLGLLDSPTPFYFGDPEFRGQDIGQRGAAQRFGIGLGGQPVDDPMVHRGLGAHHNLSPVRNCSSSVCVSASSDSPATLALAASHSS